MTVLLGCSKTDVATGDTSTTASTAKPAAGGAGTTEPERGTSTTKKGSTTTTEESGDSTTTTKKSSTTTTAKSGSTTTTEKSGSTTTTEADGPTTTVVVTTDDKPLCDKIADLDKEFQNLDPTKDPEAIEKIKEAFDGLVAVAPDDIKPTLEQFVAGMKDVKTLEDFAKLETDPTLKAASDKMTTWEKTHCNNKDD